MPVDPIDGLLSLLPPDAELDEEAVQKWRAWMIEPLVDWVALITVQLPGCTMQVCTGSKDMFGYVAVPMEIVLEQGIPRITCHLWPYDIKTTYIKIRLVRAAAKMYKALSVYSGPATISSSGKLRDIDRPLSDAERAAAIAAVKQANGLDPDGKRTYILQDSDWDWDCADGQGIFVTAASPEEAVKKVVARGGFDGAHFKIATLNLIGFMGWDHAEGFDEFQPFKEQSIPCMDKS